LKTIQIALALVLAMGLVTTWAADPMMSDKAMPNKTMSDKSMSGKSMPEKSMSDKAGHMGGEQTATDKTTTEASAPEMMANTGTVSRASFTSAVENREPTDQLSSVNNNQGEIMYFTELRNMAGQSVTHRWEHDGKVMAEVPFNVGGNRWRVYSSKKLDPSWTGSWKASVISANGETMSVSTFNYEVASQADSQAASQDNSQATAAPDATAESQPAAQ